MAEGRLRGSQCQLVSEQAAISRWLSQRGGCQAAISPIGEAPRASEGGQILIYNYIIISYMFLLSC